MAVIETRQLRKFFGLHGPTKECRLYLPAFSGPTRIQFRPRKASRSTKSVQTVALRYPGRAFADRDARAAFYVTSILSRAVDCNNIRWEEAATYTPGQPGTVFLFGSRSNQATQWATGPSNLGKFIQFDFGRQWSIRARNDVFSLSAPDKLSREQYEQKTDYGVIGRFWGIDGSAVFLIAGLGSRATEGCGYYLAKRWKELATRFPTVDFAVVLKFDPPIDPRRGEEIAAFDANPAQRTA